MLDKMPKRRSVRIALTALVSAAVLGGTFGAGMAVASHVSGHVNLSGKSVVAKKVATHTGATSYSGGTWQAIVGSGLDIVVPSGTTRLATSTFAAETDCSGGTAGNWCSARVVGRAPSGALVEFLPASGIDFAFDTVSGTTDWWESHSMNRSKTLTAGTWRVWVEIATTSSGTSLRVDDWHHSVDVLTR